jgi:hypothetical protein
MRSICGAFTRNHSGLTVISAVSMDSEIILRGSIPKPSTVQFAALSY